MMKLLKQSGLVMLALLVGASTAFAAKEAQGVLRVEDKAKLFSAEGIKKAEDKFHDVTFKAKTHWTVVTINDVPESKKADLAAVGDNKPKASSFFHDLAASMAKERNEVGVFTLIYMKGDRFMVKTVSDKASELSRSFTETDCKTLTDKLADAISAAKKKTGDEAVTERDSGLMAGTSFVIDQLKDTSLPEAKKTTGTISKANNDVKASTGMSIGNWICIGLVAALSIWVVIALIRALTGGGGGGYGGGGYGGGMGGGGMGFFGSFMTGMLGAAAGMWMYNSFFGGNHANDMAASGGDNYGGDTGATDTGEGDFDGGAGDGGGAGDWGGGDAGGGDVGGGGDWGGDTGGGGDWGGGDAGGGDFGGGGGDW